MIDSMSERSIDLSRGERVFVIVMNIYEYLIDNISVMFECVAYTRYSISVGMVV